MKANVVRFFAAWTLILIPTVSLAAPFADVEPGHPYAPAIQSLWDQGIVEGIMRPGDTRIFWPDASITRAEFVKMVTAALYPQTYVTGCMKDLAGLQKYGLGDWFPDIEKDAWFAPYICTAWSDGMITGYPDGAFHPHDAVTFVETAKILSVGFRLTSTALPDLNTLDEQWYQPFVKTLEDQHAIPATIKKFTQRVTRGEVADMLDRLLKGTDPATRETMKYGDIAKGVQWKTYEDASRTFRLSYPDSWPAPALLPHPHFDERAPALTPAWTLFTGPAAKCLGAGTCIERQFSLSTFPFSEAKDAVSDLKSNPLTSVLSDVTTERVRTILFDEALPVCTVKNAYIITPETFYRFSEHCGGSLSDPKNVFLTLLARLQLLRAGTE